MHGRWGKRLLVTVAIEADDPAAVGDTGSYRSLDGLDRLHALCREHGVRPTYLLTYSAAGEGRCVERLTTWRAEAEIGAHLHPEEVPPIAADEAGVTTLRPRDVAPERLREKMRNLVERVTEAMGEPPTSYRAGFLDMTPVQAAELPKLGILADSSLGPLDKTREGYRYVRASMAPYELDGADPCRVGDSGVVEVPVTSVFRRPFPRGLWVAAPGRVRGLLRRLGLAELLRFRPAMASAEELLTVCRRTERMGVPAVLSIHSNELAPGTSRSVPTEAASEDYFESLRRVFAFARDAGWSAPTLTELAREALR